MKSLFLGVALIGWLAVSTACGVWAAPMLFSVTGWGWEQAASAEAYAIGHREAGLWTEERAQEVINEAQVAKQHLRRLGGVLGACTGAFPVLAFLLALAPHRWEEIVW